MKPILVDLPTDAPARIRRIDADIREIMVEWTAEQYGYRLDRYESWTLGRSEKLFEIEVTIATDGILEGLVRTPIKMRMDLGHIGTATDTRGEATRIQQDILQTIGPQQSWKAARPPGTLRYLVDPMLAWQMRNLGDGQIAWAMDKANRMKHDERFMIPDDLAVRTQTKSISLYHDYDATDHSIILKAHCTLGEGVKWRRGRISIPQLLPETIARGLKGRRLGDLVQHPGIDPETVIQKAKVRTRTTDVHIAIPDMAMRDAIPERLLPHAETLAGVSFARDY